MQLKDLASLLRVPDDKVGALEITGLTSDSRKVAPGFLFAALKGARADGAAFIAEAVSRGAAVIVAAFDSHIGNVGIPVIKVEDPRRALSLAAASFYEIQPVTMAAVTGTSGKTSVAAFLRQIWAAAGFAAASIGTVGVVSPGRNSYGSLTTPDPVELHALLRALCEDGVTHAVMEASSHGLDQRRLDGVHLSVGAFTNLGRDHMDYHPTVEAYHAAKMRLFNELLPRGAPAVIFADGAWSQATINVARRAGCDVRTVGRQGDFVAIKRVEHERFRQHLELEAEGTVYEISIPLAGDFQVANAVVAAGMAMSSGVPAAAAMKAIADLKGAPGRLELVGTTKKRAPVYVDYAHKPDALENVLSSVRPFTTGRVIVAFGCGGDRDRGKRPMMGEIATRLADVVIITDDNPRSEEPAAIRAEILAGAPGAIEIPDRRRAIAEAVAMMGEGDTLVVAGKGHEEGQIIGGVTHPFSDRAEVARALKERAA